MGLCPLGCNLCENDTVCLDDQGQIDNSTETTESVEGDEGV